MAVTPTKTAECIESGCERPPHSRNLCSVHYYRRKKAGTLPPKLIDICGSWEKPKRAQRRLWSAEECLEEGCSSRPIARNLCSLHYQRRMREGTAPPKIRVALTGKRCAVEGCAAKALARQMCRRHYSRSMRYGYAISELGALDSADRCEACGNAAEGTTSRGLHVDHDHVTGDVRGLICADCNNALGNLRDSVPRLVGLLNYLVQWQQRSLYGVDPE